MKAVVFAHYGPPELLQLREIEKPVPNDDQVLVKIHAASANAREWRLFTMPPLVIRFMDAAMLKQKNVPLGVDIAGRVEAVGANVKQFKSGDAVFGVARGAFAEYACAGEHKLALKPDNVSFEAAAAVPVAGFTALQGLRDKGRIQAGQKVLINGASGGVGTFAVQIAKAFGAEVTAVVRTRNLDMARSIGADHVIDYTREDFTKNDQRYDLILAVNGYHPILDYRRALSPNGLYLSAGGSMPQIFEGMFLGRLLSKFGSKRLGSMGVAVTNQKDLIVLKEFLEAGKIAPVIDRCYPLSEVPQAMRYLVDEHARGKVVITVAN